MPAYFGKRRSDEDGDAEAVLVKEMTAAPAGPVVAGLRDHNVAYYVAAVSADVQQLQHRWQDAYRLHVIRKTPPPPPPSIFAAAAVAAPAAPVATGDTADAAEAAEAAAAAAAAADAAAAAAAAAADAAPAEDPTVWALQLGILTGVATTTPPPSTAAGNGAPKKPPAAAVTLWLQEASATAERQKFMAVARLAGAGFAIRCRVDAKNWFLKVPPSGGLAWTKGVGAVEKEEDASTFVRLANGQLQCLDEVGRPGNKNGDRTVVLSVANPAGLFQVGAKKPSKVYATDATSGDCDPVVVVFNPW